MRISIGIAAGVCLISATSLGATRYTSKTAAQAIRRAERGWRPKAAAIEKIRSNALKDIAAQNAPTRDMQVASRAFQSAAKRTVGRLSRRVFEGGSGLLMVTGYDGPGHGPGMDGYGETHPMIAVDRSGKLYEVQKSVWGGPPEAVKQLDPASLIRGEISRSGRKLTLNTLLKEISIAGRKAG